APAGASLVMPRVAAIARVVEVDRIFAEPTPAHNGSLTPLAPSLAPNRSSQDRIVPLTCGAKGTRTPGLLHAMQALYQLSYSPSAAASGLPTAPRQCTRSGGLSGRR